MNFRGRSLLLACFTLAVLAVPRHTRRLLEQDEPRKTADSAPTKTCLALTDANGPWMILAASFSGSGADQQARDLVEELRTRYKLPAYVYQKEFDFSKPLQGRGVDRYGDPQAMKYVAARTFWRSP